MTTQTLLDQYADVYKIVKATDTLLGNPETEPFGDALRRGFSDLYEFVQKYRQADLLAQHADDTREMSALLLCIARTSMQVRAVYDKYQYMDKPLSDRTMFSNDYLGVILADLWEAIKDAKSNQEDFEKMEGYGDAGQLAALADEQRARIAELEAQVANVDQYIEVAAQKHISPLAQRLEAVSKSYAAIDQMQQERLAFMTDRAAKLELQLAQAERIAVGYADDNKALQKQYDIALEILNQVANRIKADPESPLGTQFAVYAGEKEMALELIKTLEQQVADYEASLNPNHGIG